MLLNKDPHTPPLGCKSSESEIGPLRREIILWNSTADARMWLDDLVAVMQPFGTDGAVLAVTRQANSKACQPTVEGRPTAFGNVDEDDRIRLTLPNDGRLARCRPPPVPTCRVEDTRSSDVGDLVIEISTGRTEG